ncbi:MAG: Hsp20/alpha crystallin family protein [Spirochaetes bacterium]|nr:Hsp20/alpha crystallin family protein [Spirochaetota bacterium]
MNALSYYGTSPFDLIDRIFSDDRTMEEGYRMPAIDVLEKKDSYVIEAELPGLNEKDIKLEIKERVLSLSTEKMSKKDGQDDNGTWIRRERSDLRFSRTFTLPEDTDVDKIEAKFRDGLLSIELPRKPESAPKVLTVKVA